MARRHKGNPVNGWVVIDKPAGVTSINAVSKARWAFQAGKAGHAGTLDPLATGVLAVAFGEATKTVALAQEGPKTYRFTLRLGQATATDDAEGEVIASSGHRPADADIDAALAAYTGDILQIPPQFSAVKVAGERAYDLARAGVALDLAARPLHVARLTLIARPDPDHAELEMVCGKGGYVRAVARDLGEALGCLGHVESLRRLWSGPFDLAHAVTLEEIEAEARTPALEARLLPLEVALDGLPEVRCTPAGAARLRNGNPGQVLSAEAQYGDEAWASFEGQAVAVGIYRAGELAPSRVFNR
jgi:tRNA pseudouridine55 synthase